MPRPNLRAFLAAIAAFVISACQQQTDPSAATASEAELVSAEVRPKLGLMTSLPLYWPLDADFAEIAQGNGEDPWQREMLERRFEVVPLDTLSPIPALSPDDPDIDPLEGLEYIAIVQPRGLSPADNVALDDWVRKGGQLLIMLDPMLTGEYDIPLGDPRRPNDMALDLPVLPRWGVVGAFSPAITDIRIIPLSAGDVPVWMGSELRGLTEESGKNGCRVHDSKLISRCEKIGKGVVTYLGDAAVLEHRELAGEDGESVAALLEYAFQ